MTFSRLQKYLGLLIDLTILSPLLNLVFKSFQDQHPVMQENILLSSSVAAGLTLFFIVIAYGLFFRYVFRQTPGKYLVHLSTKNNPKNALIKFRMPRNTGYASLCLILIFSTLTILKPPHTQLQIVRSFCPEIDESLKTWNSIAEPHPSRLSLSLALFGAEALPASCLEQEAQYEILHQRHLPEAYLALTMLQSRLARIELSTICSLQSQADTCLLAKDLSFIKDYRGLASLESTRLQHEYVRIFQIKNLEKKQEYREALSLLEQADQPTALSYFIAQKKLEFLWKLDKKNEARSSYLHSFGFIPAAQKLHYSQLMCELEFLDSCNAITSRACKDYSELESQSPSLHPMQTPKCMSSALAPLTRSRKQLQD